jgi:hypothetical protein
MRGRVVVLALVAALVVVVPAAARLGGGRAVPKHYVWVLRVNARPGSSTHGFPRVRVSGGGSGTFSIADSFTDADGTVSWHVVDAKGSFLLATAAGVFVRGVVVGGFYGVEKATAGYLRSVSFNVRITSSSRFHCAKPQSLLELGDLDPLEKGDLDSAGFSACGAGLGWDSVPPDLIVTVHPG